MLTPVQPAEASRVNLPTRSERVRPTIGSDHERVVRVMPSLRLQRMLALVANGRLEPVSSRDRCPRRLGSPHKPLTYTAGGWYTSSRANRTGG